MKRMIALIGIAALLLMIGASVFAFDDPGSGGVIIDGETNPGGVIFDDNTATPIPEYEIFDALEITKDPTNETKKAGEECVFTAKANGAEYVLWYIITPAGVTHLASDIPTLYKGVTVTGAQSNRLVLGNITAAMNGSKFYATYTAGDLTLHTTSALLTIQGAVATPTPAAAPTPTPTAAPTPTPGNASGVVSTYGNNGTGGTGGGVQSDGSTSFLGSNGQNYNADTSIGNDNTANEPSSGTNGNTTKIENTSSSSGSVGAYVLAGVAGLVIIGSVLLMVLYMRGKISLGRFERFLGNFGGDETEMFDDEQDFYNPDDFNNKNNRQT